LSKANTTTRQTVDEQDTQSDDPPLRAFRSWSEGKEERRLYEGEDYDSPYQHPVEHAYSYKSELRKFAQAKDVGRHFVQEYEQFTTVLLTYTQDRDDGETVVEHANRFYPRTIVRDRRHCVKETGHYDEYAGVSLLAPKDVAPSPTAQTTHAHDMNWLPGFVSSEHFDRLRQREGVHVSIRYHRSDKVQTPSSVNRVDLDRERGPTSALPHEVGANLPVLAAVEGFREQVQTMDDANSARLKSTLDARQCPEYVERWCAHLSCGEDGDPSTNGVRRWRPLGRFTEIADNMKENRGYGSEGVGATESGEGTVSVPDEWADILSEDEQLFVREYVYKGLSTDRHTIEKYVRRNRDKFENRCVSTKRLIQAVQEVG